MISQPKRYDLPQRELQDVDFCQFCSRVLGVSPARVRTDIDSWIEEDVGHGDVSGNLLPVGERRAFLVAKQEFVLAGLPLVAEIFRRASGGHTRVFAEHADGELVTKGQVVFGAIGDASALVMAERVALNLGAHLSGIASKTRSVVLALQSTSVANPPQILETRKTTPGLRLYEKYATRVGGARNHRHGLDGGVMLKENHLRVLGGVAEGTRHAQKLAPVLSRIEVEVTSLDEFRQALETEPDVIMLDNFSAADICIAVSERNQANSRSKLEISGNLDRQGVDFIAKSGVDFASMGALIHQAVWVDWSLQLEL